jgi:hypothetical protein
MEEQLARLLQIEAIVDIPFETQGDLGICHRAAIILGNKRRWHHINGAAVIVSTHEH